MTWYVNADGLDRPMAFDDEAAARSWAEEHFPRGGFTIVEQLTYDVGRFEDVAREPDPEE